MDTARRRPSIGRESTSAQPRRGGGIGEIEDQHDVADIAFGCRREVGIAAIEIETMHTTAGRAPFRDQLRLARPAHIVNSDAAAEVVRAPLSDLLVIHEHDAMQLAPCASAILPAHRCLRAGGGGADRIRRRCSCRAGRACGRYRGSCPRPRPVRRRGSRNATLGWCLLASRATQGTAQRSG